MFNIIVCKQGTAIESESQSGERTLLMNKNEKSKEGKNAIWTCMLISYYVKFFNGELF